MKMLITVLVGCALVASCQTGAGNANPNPSPTRTKSFKYSNTDGQTQATAVEVRTRSPTEGGILIKDWIRANHPGYTITEQELIPDTMLRKMYNMVTIIGPSNTSRRVYFDVTQFYERVGGNLPENPFPSPR
jgi:hypothetical protein